MTKHKLLCLIADLHSLVHSLPDDRGTMKVRSSRTIRRPKEIALFDVSSIPELKLVSDFLALHSDEVMTTTRLLEGALHIQVVDQSVWDCYKLKAIMTHLGYRRKSRKVGNTVLKCWMPV